MLGLGLGLGQGFWLGQGLGFGQMLGQGLGSTRVWDKLLFFLFYSIKQLLINRC